MLQARRSTLLLVDFQQRLAPVIDGAQETIEQAERLARAAQLVGVPVLATEQIPEKLGATADALLPLPEKIIAKLSFDATGEPGLREALDERRETVLVTGWEAHVCVLQTTFGLVRAGFTPVVVADAVASRKPFSKDIALRRIAARGIEIVTVEMAIFEWLERADHPRFREALPLIR
ncbi:nicotinamidase-related amidase [Pseudochelatococcus lubricantis]|uniref:Nicotinamidase-related amidase n=1 Tax=Pseudochelatococcus lubricantis TaxID=1538102 RepID=A0ABX0UVI4_9HYPH|nr:isochorismatase family protein [Pseudochelatococcus lubricantis]NIJ56966.1 nicotinamidase-related amidase [Pseudochelatococcus lubricantis]